MKIVVWARVILPTGVQSGVVVAIDSTHYCLDVDRAGYRHVYDMVGREDIEEEDFWEDM